jgi:hypothetical protein
MTNTESIETAAACPATMHTPERGRTACNDVAGHTGAHTGANGRSWTA